MKHLGTVTIETPRLILRRLTVDDAQAMYDNWASDPEVTKYLTWPTYQHIEGARTILAEWEQNYEQDDFYQWGIVPKELGQPIGSISVVNRKDAAEKVEIGYCIGSRWWHRGIMTEALKAVIGHGFGSMNLNRIEAQHETGNPASGAVMRKCGMQREGTLRQRLYNKGRYVDMELYAILRKDYQSRKK